jgi:hypothetical protein
MKFTLKATRCKFENSGVPGIGRTMSFLMFSDDIGTPIQIEAANGAELSARPCLHSRSNGRRPPVHSSSLSFCSGSNALSQAIGSKNGR